MTVAASSRGCFNNSINNSNSNSNCNNIHSINNNSNNGTELLAGCRANIIMGNFVCVIFTFTFKA